LILAIECGIAVEGVKKYFPGDRIVAYKINEIKEKTIIKLNTKPFSRSERVEQQVLKTINHILTRDGFEKVWFYNIFRVKMTSDLKHANLYYSIINPYKKLKDYQ